MFRFIDMHLKRWAADSDRKPLLLRGARQVGKTFAVRILGKEFPSFVEINFEQSPQLRKIFEEGKDLDPERILRDLSLALKTEIIPDKTLLFLDEIQTIPNAIIALRYFYEKMPSLHVIAAGSLLDFAIEKVGIPVGRVNFLYMYPLSWLEFLKASGYDAMIDEILNHDIEKPESEFIHKKLLELLREYLALGGMPEVIKNWIQSKDALSITKIHQSIIQSYRQDFQKYAKSHQIKYVDCIFDGALHQIGKKFKFHQLGYDYRKRELAPAVDLLEKAGVLHRIYHTDGHGVPIGAQKDLNIFKLIFLDVGLSQALLGLDLADWFLNGAPSFINKGSLIEAFIGQEMIAYADPASPASLYYWQREQKGSEAEIDYLIQKNTKIVPIEVKSAKGHSLKSMRIFLDNHPNSDYGLRFSTHNFSSQEMIRSYPLYAVPLAMQWQIPDP